MKIIIRTNEKGLKLLKSVGVEYEELWREEKAEAKLIPGKERAVDEKKRVLKYGRGGFIKVEKLPDETDQTSPAKAVRIIQGYLEENKLIQLYRPEAGKLVARRLKLVMGHGVVAIALDKGWLKVVK